MDTETFLIDEAGNIHGIYSEEFDIRELGPAKLRRASHVDPDESGNFYVDMGPVGGPMFGNFKQRSHALAAEVAWINHKLDQGIVPGGENNGS